MKKVVVKVDNIEYVCKVSADFDGLMAKVKIFRERKKLDVRHFWIEDYDNITSGVVQMVKYYLEDNVGITNIYKKWKKFENSIDKDLFVCYNNGVKGGNENENE